MRGNTYWMPIYGVSLGLSLAGIAVSDPTGGKYESLLCVARQWSLRPAHRSPTNVVCLSVILNVVNEEA